MYLTCLRELEVQCVSKWDVEHRGLRMLSELVETLIGKPFSYFANEDNLSIRPCCLIHL